MIRSCKYNQNEDKCIPSSSDQMSDYECILDNNTCYTILEHIDLKESSKIVDKIRSPRKTKIIRSAYPKSKIIPSPPYPSEKENMDVQCIDMMLKYISGPASWYYFEMNGRKFHFFGDIHHSYEYNCESLGMKCSSDRYNVDCECYDFLFLLELIFSNAEISGKLVDFFLEVPYLLPGETAIDVTPNDMISKVYQHFKNCFERNKSKCIYKNSRLHYVDVRQSLFSGKISETTTLHMFLSKLLTNLKVEALSILIKPSTSKIESFKLNSEWLNSLFQMFFTQTSNHTPLSIKYLESRFSSDYFQDLNSIFQNILTEINQQKYSEQIKMLKTVITKDKLVSKQYPKKVKGQKFVHPIKVQFEELKKDIIQQPDIYPKDLDQKIKNFIMWKGNDYLAKIKSLWDNFYKTIILEIYKDPTQKTLKNRLIDIQEFELNRKLVGLDALILDAYTLMRMFRTYTSSMKQTKFPDMTITYTGARHASIYREFFEDVLKIHPVATRESMKDTKRCIKDDNFSTYFSDSIKL
jgi:hypothetical protein